MGEHWRQLVRLASPMEGLRLDRKEIETALGNAVDELIQSDRYLLEVDASERSISHHLAVYLAGQVPKFNVDCEYNRDGFNPKSLYLGELPYTDALEDEAVTVFPDIIVHRRGSNEDNLLALEMKKANARRDAEFDRRKLRAFRAQLHYRHAVHLVIGIDVEGHPFHTVEWIE